MKKLLTISILAATMAATAAFAAPGNPSNSGPAKLLLAENADSGVEHGFAIAQYVVNELSNDGNQAKDIKIYLDQTSGKFQKADIALVKAVTSHDQDTIQQAVFMAARLGNEKIGGNQFSPSNDKSALVKLTVIGNTVDSQPHTYAAILMNNSKTVEIKEVALDKAAASKLMAPSHGKAVVAAVAGN